MTYPDQAFHAERLHNGLDWWGSRHSLLYATLTLLAPGSAKSFRFINRPAHDI
jgi:hypothetical protein